MISAAEKIATMYELATDWLGEPPSDKSNSVLAQCTAFDIKTEIKIVQDEAKKELALEIFKFFDQFAAIKHDKWYVKLKNKYLNYYSPHGQTTEVPRIPESTGEGAPATDKFKGPKRLHTHPAIIAAVAKFAKPISEFQMRGDGRCEWVCDHGVGHTISVPEKFKDEEAWWIHGCDGCCSVLNGIRK